MQIRQNQYPEFDAEYQQLLTSDHLNKLFGYTEEQDRLTRANLIGIGILCGLEVSVNDAGTEITISKGVGVTSLGYIVSTETRTYTEFKTYDVTQDRKYGLFVNNNNRPKFQIDELKTEASATGTTRLSAAYLQDRIVVMYVELLAENNKNCDPNSCDDKGTNVTVNLRPLLIHRNDVVKYMGARTAQSLQGNIQAGTLPVLQMRRFNVPATTITSSVSLLGAYQAILSQSFFTSLENSLAQSFSAVAPLIADLYPGNPFAGVAAKYSFLYNGSITASDLVYIQYYYDLFSDVFTAYNDFREVASEIINICVPDESLFPQHLLLGPAGNFVQQAETNRIDAAFVKLASPAVAKTDTTVGKADVSYRNDFMPSAVLRSCCAKITELRSQFKRLVTLLGKFSVQRQNFTAVQTYGTATNTATVATAQVDTVRKATLDTNVKAFDFAGLSLANVSVANLSVAKAEPLGSINISTGVNASGTVLAAGASEVNWSCPVEMNKVITPHPAWDSLSGSGWLGNAAGINAGNYTFTRSFTLPSTGTLTFQAVGDNRVTVKLDNTVIAQTPGTTTYGFKLLNVVTYTGTVAAGSHTITVTLYNEGGPAGFDLKGNIAYKIPAPPPPPPPVLPPQPPVQINIPLRITPSYLGDLPLSRKSIPYYYDAVSGTNPLFQQWDYDKTIKGKADRNLSYNSVLYNAGNPDFTNKVLRYDLERYNFLRIEGHIGDTYQNALNKITTIRDQYRLPFEVIALRSTLAPAIANEKSDCCTDGIELTYAILKAEWTDTVNNFIAYINNNPGAAGLFDAPGFINLLNEGLSYLKEDVPSFVSTYAAFMTRLTRINDTGRAYRDTIQAMQGREGEIDYTLTEDTVDHLDEVILTYKKGAFEEVYNAYRLSLASVKRALSIQEYLKENPGIQHKAGVPKGGTFILVYHTKAAPVQTTPTQQQQQQSQNNTASAKLAVSTGDIATTSIATTTATTAKVTAVNFDVVKAVDDLIIARNTGKSPAELEKQMLDVLWVRDTKEVLTVKPAVTVKTVDILENVIEGTVIADFYLPYICCDDCPTVHFVPGEDTPEQATIQIYPKEFCASDESRYEITTAPEGGTLTGDGIITENGVSYFAPSEINIAAGSNFAEPVITYATADSTTFVKLKVYAVPQVTLQQPVVTDNSVSLSYSATGAGTVSWSFGDGMLSSDPNLQSHVYNAPGTYTITLSVTNGTCGTVTDSKTVTIENISLDIDTALRDFCQGNTTGTTTYNITYSPVDAIVKIGTTTLTPVSPGVCQFTPASLSIPAGTSQTLAVTATKGTFSSSFNIKVNAVPNAVFANPSINGTTATFSYTPASGNSVLWNFGDGTSSTVASPVHNYSSAGTKHVTLTVYNNGCPAVYEKDIVIQNASISIAEPVICMDDNATLRTLTVSPTGGFVSGTGAVNGTPPKFDPSQVTFAQGELSKTVTLTYTINGLTANTTVTVYKALSKTITSTDNGDNSFTLGYTDVPANRLHWDFGDGQFADGVASIRHMYQKSGSYTVTLTVKNDPCRDVVITRVVTPKAPTISVSPGDKDICWPNDKTIRTFTVSPAGGTFSGEGVVNNTFDPSKVSFSQGQIKKDIVITYTVGTESVTTTLTVYNAVDTTFSYRQTGVGEPDAGGYTALFTYNQPYDGSLKWEFGDGSVHEGPESQVEWTYRNAGEYQVALTVPNGPCATRGTQTVVLQDWDIKFEPAGSTICLSQDTGIRTLTGTPDGGTFSGEGVANTNPATFDPTKVIFDQGSTSKVVNITYIAPGAGSTSAFITVYKALDATFTATEIGNNTVSFTYEGEFKGNLKWIFDDGQSFTGTAHQITHRYAAPRTYNVTMTLVNDPCPVVKTIPVVVKGDPARIEIAQTQFCKTGDSGEYEILVSPQGGDLSIDDVLQTAADQYFFRPSEVEGLTDGRTRLVKLRYTVNGTEAVQMLEVDTADATFGVEISGHDVRLTPLGYAYPATFDLGDGRTIETENIYGQSYAFTYDDPGSYLVSLTFKSDGICGTVSAMQQVTITGAELSVSDVRREFCANEDRTITIQGIPAGGALTVDGKPVSGSTYSFNPSHLGIQPGGRGPVITIDYTANGASVSETFWIYPLPLLNFSAEDLGTMTVRFTNTSTGGEVVSWNFGDGHTGTGEVIEHAYETEGTYSVRLTVSNGKCPDNILRDVQVARPVEPKITVDGEQDDYCTSDFNSYMVRVSPAGGVFTVDGQVLDITEYEFAAYNYSAGVVSFSYTLNGVTANRDLTVHSVGTVDYRYSLLEGNTFRFTNITPNTEVVSWDFGDGRTSEEQEPVYTFGAEGSYWVLLTVRLKDYVCTGTRFHEVTTGIPQGGPKVEIDSNGNELCGNGNNYAIVQASPDGGRFTFNGKDIPLYYEVDRAELTVPAGGTTKVLNFSYELNGYTTTKTITVYPPSKADFTWSIVGDKTVRFTNTSIDGRVLSWHFGDGKTGTGETVDHVFDSETTYNVMLVVTNDKCPDSIRKDVEVVKPEMPQLAVSHTQREFCAGNVVLVMIDGNPAGGVLKRDGVVINGTSASLDPTKEGVTPTGNPKTITYTYELNGFTATEQFTVMPEPSVSFSTEMIGLTVRFTNTSIGGSVVSWAFGDGTTGVGEVTEHKYEVEGTQNVTLTVANAYCTKQLLKPIQVVARTPELLVNTGERVFCADDAQTISIQATPDGGVFALNGTPIDGNFYNLIPAASGVKPDDSGPKTFRFAYTLDDNVAEETFTVSPLPVASFNVSGGNARTYTFTNTSGATVLSWNFGDGQTGTGDSVTHTYDVQGSYTVTLNVMNASGCANSGQQTVSTVADPKITVVNTSATDFCADDSLQVSFNVTPAGGKFYVNNVEQNVGTYRFTAKNYAPGTVNFRYDVNGLSAASSFRVNALPVAYFNVSGGNARTYTFTNTSGATVVSWNFGDGQTGSGNSVSHTYGAQGSYTVTLNVVNASGCNGSGQQTVTTVADPKITVVNTSATDFCADDSLAVSFSVSPAGGKFYVNNVETDVTSYRFMAKNYAPGTINFRYDANGLSTASSFRVNALPVASFNVSGGNARTYTFTNTSGATVVSWNFGDGQTGTGNSVSHTYGAQGSYTVTLNVVNASGCANSGQQTVTTVADPKITVVNTSATDFCADDSLAVSFSVSPAGGKFYVNNVETDVVSYRFMAKNYAPGTVNFRYDANGLSAASSFRVNALPVASFNVTGGNARAYTFTNTSGATVVSWNFGDGQTGTGNSVSHTYGAQGSYTVTLNVVNASGCANSGQQTVTTVADPKITVVNTSATDFCADDSLAVSFSVSPAGGKFYVNNVETDVVSYRFVARNYSVGTVNFRYDANGLSAASSFRVNALPVASFNVTGGNARAYTFTNTSGATVVSWNFGDGQTGTGNSVSHTYGAQGSYTVTLNVVNASGCANSGQQTVTTVADPKITVVNTSATEFCADDSLQVSFNVTPAGGKFYVNDVEQNVGTYRFMAKNYAPGTVNFRYDANGLSTASSFRVNAVPAAGFSSNPAGNMTYSFSNTTAGASVVSWNFGDGQTATGESVQHTWAAEGTYSVTLTVTNGKCNSSTTQQVTVVKPAQPQLTISDGRRSFCSNDNVNVVIQASPAGGVFTLNGAQLGSNTYNLNPAQAGVGQGAQPKTFTFSYTLNGTTATESITVYAIPLASFSNTLVGNMTYSFVNTSGATVVAWDFGNGDSGYGGQDVVQYIFEGPGDYQVSMMVTNGACLNATSAIISVTDTGTGCTLPCKGISETSTYTWPSKESYLRDQIFANGDVYTFIITKYSVEGKGLTDRLVRFDITPEQYDQQGFQAIFNAIKTVFPEGLDMTYNATGLIFGNDFVPFDIKRFACQGFELQIVDDYSHTGSEFVYTFTESGLFINGEDFPYEQKLNPVITDECIDIRTEPCNGKMTKCNYVWPHDADTIDRWMSDNAYPGYEIVVHQYEVGDAAISKNELHFVIPFTKFRNGLKDAIDLLNSHFLLREALYFGIYGMGEDGSNIITVSRYDCLNFIFDFTVTLTRDGNPDSKTSVHYLYTQEGSFIVDEGGDRRFVMDPQNCEDTIYIPHQPATCSYPCDGLTETAVYTWPDNADEVRKGLDEGGYMFTVGRYLLNGFEINSEPVTISVLREAYDKDGLAAVTNQFNQHFSDGVVFKNYTEMLLPHQDIQNGFDFTIRRFACEQFTVEITGRSGEVFAYSEKGLAINGKTAGYPQRLNTVVADACIQTRPVPCDGKTTTSSKYSWFSNNEELVGMAAEGKSYTFNVSHFVLNGKLVVAGRQTHIIPAESYRNGWSDIAAYLNEHFRFADGIVFKDKMVDSQVALTFPQCSQFSLTISDGKTDISYTETGGTSTSN